MKEDTLISIAVAVFGVEKYINQCLKSLINQSYKNIEIIVVNDGSIDGAPDICNKFAAQDSRVKVIHKKNGGLVSARKAGAASAKGEYITFVDGDDWVRNNHIESFVKHLHQNTDLVITGYTRDFLGKKKVLQNNLPAGKYPKKEIINKILPKAIYNGLFFQHGISTYLWNKLFKTSKIKKCIKNVNNSIVMGEDSCVTYPYIAASKEIVIAKSSTYIYRQRADSIIKSVPSINKEYTQLSLLFQHLQKNMLMPENLNLSLQIKNYFYALLLIRSGGILNSNTEKGFYLPFSGIRDNEKIVIYNSGSFGQHFYSALDALGKFKIVAWVDEDYDESIRAGIPITKINSLKNLHFDHILIASVDLEQSKKISIKLQNNGVSESKIKILSIVPKEINNAIRDIGFSLKDYSYKND
jgi:glycosyltransferase involved in cell wall biosynthesis